MEFRVDFTSENILPDGSNFGHVGEHNRATLVITPPAEMTDNADILYYCLACEVSKNVEFIKAVVRSEMHEKAETIRIPLWGQATIGESAKLQLEGYDGSDNLLVKTDLVEYSLSPSASGVQAATDMNGGSLAATVAKNSVQIEKLALNGGGKVKKIFIPYDVAFNYGCCSIPLGSDVSLYATNNFLNEFGLSNILPVGLTVLWKGSEMSIAELNYKAIVGVPSASHVTLLDPVDVDGVKRDKLFAIIHNADGTGDTLLNEVANDNSNGYIGGVYFYYVEKIEVVE